MRRFGYCEDVDEVMSVFRDVSLWVWVLDDDLSMYSESEPTRVAAESLSLSS